MKIIALMILMLFAVFGANAQKIHWLLFIDTDDEDVGDVDKKTRSVLTDHFVNVVNSVLVQEGYEPCVSDNYGSLVSAQNCRGIVNDLQCGSNDVIVFYYIGHGGKNPNEPSRWPMMNMGEYSPEISLEWVHNNLKSKNARLTITIGMCCNSEWDYMPLICSVDYGDNHGNTYVGFDMQETIKKLFLQNRGDILATSASPKEKSGCYYIDDKPFMDTYSYIFIKDFETLFNNQNLTWNSFFTKLGNDVSAFSSDPNKCNAHQTPMFEANVTTIAQSARPHREEPKKIETNDAVANVLKTISDNFAYVTDARSNSLEKRQTKSNEITRYFSADAKVKVYSQDGNYNVDTEPIDVYLRRIRTSGILMNVVPFDFNASGGKITVLKVKEYYRQKN